jgi:ketosteroid isomerase-like protein
MTDLRQLTAQYIAAFDKKDLPALATMMCDDFVLEDPAGRFEGRTIALDYIRGIFKAITRLEFTAREIVVEAPRSVIEFRLVLDGKVLVGTDVIEWKNGRLAELRAYLYEQA